VPAAYFFNNYEVPEKSMHNVPAKAQRLQRKTMSKDLRRYVLDVFFGFLCVHCTRRF
jgi:hypothetical protein